ncbi:unnamed protein product [Gulo gulo]|uniref:Uncharacterized protein n=1 Tax=Gulo gulo TaxID=48420 RepID=A0A9X9LLH8_GULGU|nr:unnamed protein product [Gulo gulo]
MRNWMSCVGRKAQSARPGTGPSRRPPGPPHTLLTTFCCWACFCRRLATSRHRASFSLEHTGAVSYPHAPSHALGRCRVAGSPAVTALWPLCARLHSWGRTYRRSGWGVRWRGLLRKGLGGLGRTQDRAPLPPPTISAPTEPEETREGEPSSQAGERPMGVILCLWGARGCSPGLEMAHR